MAVALVCTTFPLIWVGGLVTTYDAGMAVPDWPSTYGYNLFLYPWQTWLAGPFDLFIEHGHRLLGALVGLMAISTLVALKRYDDRRWVIGVAVGVLGLVVLQGLLGGLRVLRDSRQIAQIHGIVGPTFFVSTIFLAAVTSRWWSSVGRGQPDHRAARTPSLPADDVVFVDSVRMAAWFATGLAFAQLVLGSQLRHVDEFSTHQLFGAALTMHIAVAVVLLVHGVVLSLRVALQRKRTLLTAPGIALGVLVVSQVVLGTSTWIVRYGWPAMFRPFLGERNITVQAEGLLQGLVATSHVAVGALILGVSFLLAVRCTRVVSMANTGSPDQLTAGAIA